MAINRLRKLRRVEENKGEKIFKRNLVVGNDLFSLELYDLLNQKYGQSEVSLLTPKKIDSEDLRIKGPNMLRGESNIKAFKCFYPEYEGLSKDDNAEFFKELKFRKFSSRSKHEKLLWGEEFFKGPKVKLEQKELFTVLKKENFYIENEKDFLVKNITGINFISTDDLLENANWEISCSNGDRMLCEHLYWGLGPKSFLDLYTEKSKLSNQFMEFCERQASPMALNIKFNFDGEITKKEETLFIPLSYTHEWGHFVGEFNLYSENEKSQSAEFLLYLNHHHTTEEEISRNIRILKKNLEKIFPKIKTTKAKEYISLSENVACQNIDDYLFPRGEFENKKINFIGFNAPLDEKEFNFDTFADSSKGLSHLMRGFVTHQNITKNIHLS